VFDWFFCWYNIFNVLVLNNSFRNAYFWNVGITVFTDSPGIESRWVCDFSHTTGPGAHPASCTMGTGSFSGVKRPGRGADHPPPSSAGVKKGQSYTSIHTYGQLGL
jgi:hypothetical protein